MSDNRTFTAAMVQMRTGLMPEPSLAQATRLIRQAAANGADYVQTPEVSNMMQLNRKALVARGARLRTSGLCTVASTKPFATAFAVAGVMDAHIAYRARRLTERPT